MGKGNREKLKKAQAQSEASVFTKNKKAKKGSPAWVSTLVVILIVALLVSCIVLTVISEGGYMLRWTKVIESDNFTVTGTMMSYYFYSGYNTFLNYYGSYAQYLGLDTSASLKTQTYGETEGTWFDYFMDQAISQAEMVSVYCEEAKVRGIKLDDEDYADIDEAVANLRSAAAEKNYLFEGYISAVFGTGVKLKDVRRALEMSQLAAKCSEIVQGELKNAITGEIVNSYYDENKTNFWTADFLSYSFTAAASDDASYDYEAEKAKRDQLGAELLACAAEEGFRKYVAEYVARENYDALYSIKAEEYDASVLPDEAALAIYKTNITAAAVENALADRTVETTTSTDTLDKIFNSIESDLTAKVSSALAALENDEYAWSDPAAEGATDEVKWVSDDARAAGDMTVISETGEDDYTVTVYLMKKPMRRDETPSRNVGHILFKPDTYVTDEAAKLKAEEILAQYEGGEKTKEAFEALAKEYNEDSNNFYDDVIKGQMVEEFEDWLFDAARAAGDVGIVKTEYGYHIMYYAGESSLDTWYVKVKSAVLSENSEKWYEENFAGYGITTDREAANKVNA